MPTVTHTLVYYHYLEWGATMTPASTWLFTAPDPQFPQVCKANAAMGLQHSPSPRLHSIALCQEWIDHILLSAWWRSKSYIQEVYAYYLPFYPNRAFLSYRHSPVSDRTSNHSINLPPWARNHYVILHELAHVITHPDLPYHGIEFCANHLEMVDCYLGPSQALLLRSTFAEHDVKYN